ncbi:MFS transporter [Siccirubricoccus sp. KC 17139]|uniref:MFS transporter n=1 Tax=Siccirubricoccus soli TaxID=2899147 RepID=A0ABT1DB93_9PROT|nr:MFS transporter [Siccirubricoccus soli]MCO6419210.1 MFS transporter [Siccirubricoccus soli]MCP2685345.1 MFS transporter [Siccirubricoccus soli]
MPVADRAAPWAAGGVDSPYAWARLALAVALNTLGGVGLWSIVVALPAVQAEFGTARAAAALPYTLTTIGFALGGVLMGRLADRFGVMWPVLGGSLSLGLGYLLAAQAGDITSFALIHGLFIGLLGACAMFGPLVADTSLWFRQRRGLAVAICACGNYFAGTVWPPLLQWGIAGLGWRRTHELVGIACLVLLLPLALLLRRKPPQQEAVTRTGGGGGTALGLSPNVLQGVLVAAGIACCVAMAMPQVHIVAYCVDLGYGAARGAEMLSLMLATGVLSRLAFGLVMDRIGALSTLVLASLLQAVALALFLPFDGLVPLYVISGLFGLFQGGIVPCYAVIVRENFPASEVGVRVSLALSSTLVGMALGGWMSGFVFDLTGSYRMAVVNGLIWNGVHLALAGWLLWRGRARRVAFA